MAKKQVVCDETDNHYQRKESVTASELEAQHQDKTLPTPIIEVHDGKFKSIDGCQPQDFFHAHLLAKDRATSHMRSAEFLLAQSEYYRKLSSIQ